MNYYWLCVRASGVVGPHKFSAIREWFARGVIGADWKVCEMGTEVWLSVSEIPNIERLPKELAKRIEADRHWNAFHKGAVSSAQMFKLRYFEIPLPEAEMNIRRASEILTCFAQMDPGTETKYQNRPATPEDIRNMNSVGSRPTKQMTHGEAVLRYQQIMERRGQGSWP